MQSCYAEHCVSFEFVRVYVKAAFDPPSRSYKSPELEQASHTIEPIPEIQKYSPYCKNIKIYTMCETLQFITLVNNHITLNRAHTSVLNLPFARHSNSKKYL